MSDEVVAVEIVASGEVQVLPYRKAVSLLSRGLAVHATQTTAETEQTLPTVQTVAQPQDDPKDAKDDSKSVKEKTKNTLSAPARKGQEGVNAENKPLSDE